MFLFLMKEFQFPQISLIIVPFERITDVLIFERIDILEKERNQGEINDVEKNKSNENELNNYEL